MVGLSKAGSASSLLQWVKYPIKKAEAPGELGSLSVSLSIPSFPYLKWRSVLSLFIVITKPFRKEGLCHSSSHEAPLVGLWSSLSPFCDRKFVSLVSLDFNSSS